MPNREKPVFRCLFFTSAPYSSMHILLVFGASGKAEARDAITWFIGEEPRLFSCETGNYPLPDEWIEVLENGYEYHTKNEAQVQK